MDHYQKLENYGVRKSDEDLNFRTGKIVARSIVAKLRFKCDN